MNTILPGSTMTSVKLPYVNSISNPPLLISTTSNSSGQKHESSLRKPRRKVGKTVNQLGFSNQNQHNLEDDWENPRKISNTSQKTQTEATIRKDRRTSRDIFRKFFPQKLQSTIHFLQKQIRETKTQF